MRDIQVELYSAEELKQINPEGFKNAWQQYARTISTDYILCDALACINTCAYTLGYRVDLRKFDINEQHNQFNPLIYSIRPISDLEEERDGKPLSMKGEQLYNYLQETAPQIFDKLYSPTGSRFDKVFFEAIRSNLKETDKNYRPNLDTILGDCVLSVFQASQKEARDLKSEKGFLEFCEQNEAEFFYNGDIW